MIIMPRGSGWLGLPVIDASDGRRLGRVQDLVLDPDCSVVAALVVNAGLGRPPLVVDWQAVQGVGSAVVCHHPARAAATNLGTAQAGCRWSALQGKWVLTELGEELGLVCDLWLDSQGAVTGYQLSCGLIEDLWAGQQVLSPPPPLRVGADAVFIAGGARDLEVTP